MKLIRGCFLLLFISSSLAGLAQNDSTFFNRIASSLSKWQQVNPVEKVYLHLDKPYYAAGDDIWFKAYVTAGAKHQLSGISGVLNVELIDNKDSVVQYIKLPVVSGLTWGDFKLPDTVREGNYRVRAYTRWMRNAGPDFFYDHSITIGNAIPSNKTGNNNKPTGQARQVKTAKPASNKTKVQFFPESGDLVYGIASKVAFKALGDDGLGKDIKGVIVDEQNREVSRFSSSHLGMGVFYLFPDSGKQYKANITYTDGSVNSVSLPAPLVKGYVLHISNADSLNIAVKIDGNANLADRSPDGVVNLIAQAGGEIFYAARSKAGNSSFAGVIPKSKFPSGIVQFTLFSSAGEPLNERLFFIKNRDLLNLSVSADGNNFTTRQKMKINVGVKDNRGKPVFGNFSAAVIDETKALIDENAESTIFSNLLLTSDIQGYVEKPNYYFTNTNKQTEEDLDVLMLTQGYHRFEWKRILAGNLTPGMYQPETAIEITGHLKTAGGKPIARGKVSLLSSSTGFFMLDALSDDNGYFAFKNLQFKDSVKFVIQSKAKKNLNNVYVELDGSGLASTHNKNLPVQSFNVNDSLAVYLANSRKTYNEQMKYGTGGHIIALKEVKIIEKKPMLNSSNLNGPGNADQVLLAKDIDTGCPTIADCLQGKLVGIFFVYEPMRCGCYIPYTSRYGGKVQVNIKVDGMDMTAEMLNTLTPSMVESVEILKNGSKTSIYGPDGSKGLILINTKKSNYINYAKPNIVTYMPKGYYKARLFYSPQYDDPKINPKIADLRSTIYWNPNVATDKNGQALLEYFNADTKGTYRIVIEGIDENGNLGRQVYRYKVE